MAKNWYVKHKGRVVGPASSAQLKQLASSGKISRETEVRLGEDGEWVSASSVQGLWTQVVVAPKPTIEQVAERALYAPPPPTHATPAVVSPVRHPSPTAPQQPSRPPVPATISESQYDLPTVPTQQSQKPCMYCGESIAQTAIKCRHCGEFLDGRPRETQQQAPQVIVTQNVGSHNQGYQQPIVVAQSSALGGLLSFFIPGLGQLCTGRPLAGIVWFIATIIGYAAFIFPGLVLHLICIVDASKVNGIRIG